jgi:hypothetical protein
LKICSPSLYQFVNVHAPITILTRILQRRRRSEFNIIYVLDNYTRSWSYRRRQRRGNIFNVEYLE